MILTILVGILDTMELLNVTFFFFWDNLAECDLSDTSMSKWF